MKYLLVWFLCWSLTACASAATCPCGPAPSAPAPEKVASVGEGAVPPEDAATDDAATDAPQAGFDAELSGYDYPFPVQRFETSLQGRDVSMAYMVLSEKGTKRGTVTLLHGKNFSGAYWARTAKALSDAGYAVVMPDQIGFGKSDKPLDVQYSFHALATLTRRLLDNLGVEASSLVGHSMGGMLATRFSLMFPERVTALALVNPIGLEDWKRKVPYVTVEEWVKRNKRATPASIKAYMRKNYFDGQWREAYDSLVEIQAGWAIGPDQDRIARVSALHYDMIFTQPVVHEFPDIRVPTLLIIGQRDRTALGKSDVAPDVAETLGNYPALGRAAAEAIPNAKLVPLKAVGHVPQVEAFDAYIDALLGFLSQHMGNASPTG